MTAVTVGKGLCGSHCKTFAKKGTACRVESLDVDAPTKADAVVGVPDAVSEDTLIAKNRTDVNLEIDVLVFFRSRL